MGREKRRWNIDVGVKIICQTVVGEWSRWWWWWWSQLYFQLPLQWSWLKQMRFLDLFQSVKYLLQILFSYLIEFIFLCYVVNITLPAESYLIFRNHLTHSSTLTIRPVQPDINPLVLYILNNKRQKSPVALSSNTVFIRLWPWRDGCWHHALAEMHFWDFCWRANVKTLISIWHSVAWNSFACERGVSLIIVL